MSNRVQSSRVIFVSKRRTDPILLFGVLKPILSLGFATSLVIAAPCLSRCDPVAANPPKDAELVASFRSHHDAFEKLAAMGMEDTGIVSLLRPKMLNERRLTGGRQSLSPERRSEYVRPSPASDRIWLWV